MSNNTKRILPRLPVVGGLAALAFLLFVPDTAQAQVLFACYVPSSGVVYRIKESGLKDECTGQKHVEFSWNEGSSGGLGIEYVTITADAITRPFTLVVPCSAGKMVIGGGFEAIFVGNDDVEEIKQFQPNDDRTAWVVTIEFTDDPSPSALRVTAICA